MSWRGFRDDERGQCDRGGGRGGSRGGEPNQGGQRAQGRGSGDPRNANNRETPGRPTPGQPSQINTQPMIDTSLVTASRAELELSMESLTISNALVFDAPNDEQKQAKKKTKENRDKWSKAALELAEPEEKILASSEGTQTDIRAKFFRVHVNEDADLRRYRVDIGPINGHVPSKREVRRAIIESMLQSPPTMYHTHLISTTT